MDQNASRERQRCRILNIGPDSGVQQLLAEFAQTDELVSVYHFETGTIALDILSTLSASELPHIVIVPFRLPILTGLDFIIRMRSHQQLLSVPIFVWGPQIRSDEIEKMYHAGAAGVFLGQFNTVHIQALHQFVHDSTATEDNVTRERLRCPITSPTLRTGERAGRNVRLGALFVWTGGISVALWICSVLQLGQSYNKVDLAPLPVYAGLACAGLLLMGRTHDRARVESR